MSIGGIVKESDSRTDESCSCPQESLVEIAGKLTGKASDRDRLGVPGHMATYQSDDLYRCRDCGQYWLFQYWEVVTPDNQFEEWGDTNSVWTPLTLEQREAVDTALTTGEVLPQDACRDS